jgi:PhnB protein
MAKKNRPAPKKHAAKPKLEAPRKTTRPTTPPCDMQRIIPYLICQSAAQLLDYVVRTFGFAVRERIAMPDGTVAHAEAGYQSNVVMLGTPGPQGQADMPGRRSMLYCYVDDVDSHFQRAAAAGAKVIQPLTDMFYGDRTYAVEDPEGNHWHFATHVKDVSAAEIMRGKG